ncbi:unnamed protein product [Sphenostylis stenocarpa]|uniref:Uncharacterized protein n=1 Tax=Sphenostylis stenocarpa TaxID=92480 RepID=A0AA86T439_9FABA|nr:unnamed protein product [Sphenostylis stenocarpa]
MDWFSLFYGLLLLKGSGQTGRKNKFGFNQWFPMVLPCRLRFETLWGAGRKMWQKLEAREKKLLDVAVKKQRLSAEARLLC